MSPTAEETARTDPTLEKADGSHVRAKTLNTGEVKRAPRRLTPKQAQREREAEVADALSRAMEEPPPDPSRYPAPPEVAAPTLDAPPTGEDARRERVTSRADTPTQAAAMLVEPPMVILGERDERSYFAPNVDAALAKLRGLDSDAAGVAALTEEEVASETGRPPADAPQRVHVPIAPEPVRLERTIHESPPAESGTQQPTATQYASFAAVFDHFNAELFAGALPRVLLAFSKHAKSVGYFAHRKWREAGATDPAGTVGEIALNPEHLARDERATASTVIHEMVHLWQHVTTTCKPGRRGYHNAEWAKKMIAVGLHPSDTGAPGGKSTGQRMTHYVVDDGPFDQAFRRLPKGALLPFVAGALRMEGPGITKSKKDPSKTKYTCPVCGLNAWARPTADLHHCQHPMQEAG